MKRYLCALALLMLASTASSAGLNCVYIEDYTIFDFAKLQSDTNYNRTIGDKTITFNFCQTFKLEECGDREALAFRSANGSNETADSCTALTAKSVLDSPSVHLVKTSEFKDRYLELHYEGDEGTQLHMNLICDHNEPDFNFTVTEDGELYTIDFRSKQACYKTSLNDLWRFCNNNKWIFAIVFMVVGLFENFLGRRLFRPTLFIIGLFTTVAVLLFLFYVLFLPTGTKDWVGWTVLAVSVVLGLVVGFFLAKLSRVGLFLLGAWGGAIVGLVLSETVLYKADSIAALWVPVVVLALLVGVLSFKWYNHIVIIATCVLGSYLFIRGLAIFAGGYPNEFTVYSEIRDGTISAVPGTFYAYLAGMIVLFVLGMIVQYRTKKRQEDEGKNLGIYERV